MNVIVLTEGMGGTDWLYNAFLKTFEAIRSVAMSMISSSFIPKSDIINIMKKVTNCFNITQFYESGTVVYFCYIYSVIMYCIVF